MGNTCADPTAILQGIWRTLCQVGSKLDSAFGWISGVASVTRLTATGVGTIAQGASSVSILNIGGAAGTVLGQTIAVGQALNLDALEDPVNRTFKVLPAITYDGTGTSLSIVVMT